MLGEGPGAASLQAVELASQDKGVINTRLLCVRCRRGTFDL